MVMDANIDQLLSLLARASRGAPVTEAEVRDLKWSASDSVVRRVASEAWMDLQRFVDDADIRARDRQYEESFKFGLSGRRDELEALLRGEDPFRRRRTWFHRMLWRVGIVR